MKKTSMFFICMAIAKLSAAQTLERKAALNIGQMEKRIKGTLTTSLQKDNKSMEIRINSDVTRLYTLNTRADAYEVSSKIIKIKNTLSAMGEKIDYNSDGDNDRKSQTVKYLDLVLNKPAKARVNKFGIVTTAGSASQQQSINSTLTNLTAATTENFIAGTTFELIANLPLNTVLKTGQGWVDSVAFNGGTQVINYIVKNIGNEAATIEFNGIIKSSSEKQGTNSSLTGQMEVDTATGIILKRQLQTKIVNVLQTKDGKLTTTKTSDITEITAQL